MSSPMRALLEALVKARKGGGGPYIGKRGGKWANAEHTIPWKAPSEGRAHEDRAAPLERHPRDQSPDQVGPVHFGMSLDEVEIALMGARGGEFAVVFDKSGLQLGRAKWASERDRRRVVLPEHLVIAAAVDGVAVVTHNHPGGTMLSVSDIRTALSLNLAEIRAVCPDGTVWSLKRNEGRSDWGLSEQDLDDTLSDLETIEARLFAAAKRAQDAGDDARARKLRTDGAFEVYQEYLGEAGLQGVLAARRVRGDGRGSRGRPGDDGQRGLAQPGPSGPKGQGGGVEKSSGVHRVPYDFHPVTVEPARRTRAKFPFQGFIDFQGLQVDVESVAGSFREGVDADGHRWRVKMNAHYGEVRGTEGVDGDPLDVYVLDNADSSLVVVVHQNDPTTGRYDEDKVVLGAKNVEEALALYRKQYDRPGFYGGHTAMPIGRFWRWVKDRKNRGQRVEKARAAARAEDGAMNERLIPIPRFLYERLLGLAKGAGHKYLKKVPAGVDPRTGKPRFRYYYQVTGGQGHVAHAEDLVKVGAKFQLDDGEHKGHVEVVEVDGERVKIRHDETGREEWLHKRQLELLLHRQHARAIVDQRKKAREARMREFEQAKKTGSAKQQERAKERAKATGAQVEGDAAAPKKAPPKPAAGKAPEQKAADKETARKLQALAQQATEAAPRSGQRVTRAANARMLAMKLAGGKATAADRREAARVLEAGVEGLVSGTKAPREGATRTLDVRQPEAKAAFDARPGRTAAPEPSARVQGLAGQVEGMLATAERLRGVSGVVKAIEHPVREALDELEKASPATAAALRGRWELLSRTAAGRAVGTGDETTVYVADASGQAKPQKARYRLLEADQAIASHDPTQGFAKRKDYPEGVQERVYHRDQNEQTKVRLNAQNLRPDLVINTNPDAVNGPPLLTAERLALGGNSRVMSIQLAYASDGDAAKAYRQHLLDHAHVYGFSRGEIEGMKQPMLVREVDVPAEEKGPEGLAVLVRRYNEAFTQGMDPRTKMVAEARLLTPEMLGTLSHGLSQVGPDGEPKYASLSALLDGPEGQTFVSHLGKGVFDRRNRAQYMRPDGTINEDGKRHVERLLVGRLIPDPDLLADVQTGQMQAIANAAPFILQTSHRGRDLTGPLSEALAADQYLRANPKLANRIESLDQRTLGEAAGGGDGAWGKVPRPGPEGRVILQALRERGGERQLQAFFREVSRRAEQNPLDQGGLFGSPKTTRALLEEVLAAQSKVKKSFGRFGALLKAWLTAGGLDRARRGADVREGRTRHAG